MEAVSAAFEKVADPQVIFHSPLVRARETAEFISTRIPKAKLKATPLLLPDADPREIFIALARGKGTDALLVGHQPNLGRVLGLAVTGNAEVEIPMQKASIARVSFSGSHPSPPGTLKWLIAPSLAQKIR